MSDQSHSQNTAKNTSGLRPWVKGQSGNPGGRPSHAAIRQALKPHEPATVARLIEHMLGSDAPASIMAIKLILGYLYGKPESVQVDDMSTDELLAVLMRRKEQEQAEAQARQ